MTREEIDCYLDNAKGRFNDGDLDGALLLLKTAAGAVTIYKRELANRARAERLVGVEADVLSAMCGLGADRASATAAIKYVVESAAVGRVVAGSTALGFESLFGKSFEIWRQQQSQNKPLN
jgi:hypothetical protein